MAVLDLVDGDSDGIRGGGVLQLREVVDGLGLQALLHILVQQAHLNTTEHPLVSALVKSQEKTSVADPDPRFW